MNIKGTKNTQQLTLDFEGGLIDRYTCLRDCVATGIYQRGLSRCAIDLNESPGNLSNKLSQDCTTRHLNVDELELYIEKSKDVTPIYYLIEKFLSDKSAKEDAAMVQLALQLRQLQPLLKQAGLS